MTASEEYVSGLCKGTFLSFWSFANPLRKAGKELCDILVVCDPDIIIFSVKDISIKESGDIGLDIDRWLRNAIDESVKQIYGAERVLKAKEDILLKDGKTNIKLPEKGIRNIYRVAVAFGRGDKFPLKFGDFGKGFVHVYDERSIQIILQELDTVTDFIDFLKAKESLIKSGVKILGYSGEDLLALHLQHGLDFNEPHTLLSIDDNLWVDYSKSAPYLNEKGKNKPSYIWDALVEQLHTDFQAGRLINPITLNDLEMVLRIMNRESRLARRDLGNLIMEVIGDGTDQKKPRARLAKSDAEGAPIYVFLRRPFEQREMRQKELGLRCFVAASMFAGSKVIGIGTEDYAKDKGFSIDLQYIDIPNFTEEMLIQAKAIQEDLGYFLSPMTRRKPF